jgi:hypothetical protein
MSPFPVFGGHFPTAYTFPQVDRGVEAAGSCGGDLAPLDHPRFRNWGLHRRCLCIACEIPSPASFTLSLAGTPAQNLPQEDLPALEPARGDFARH